MASVSESTSTNGTLRDVFTRDFIDLHGRSPDIDNEYADAAAFAMWCKGYTHGASWKTGGESGLAALAQREVGVGG